MAWGQGKGRWGGRQDESEPPPLQLSFEGGEGKGKEKESLKKESAAGATPLRTILRTTPWEGTMVKKERPQGRRRRLWRWNWLSLTRVSSRDYTGWRGEEEWDDEVFEALGLSEDEDTLRDSLNHTAKNALGSFFRGRRTRGVEQSRVGGLPAPHDGPG